MELFDILHRNAVAYPNRVIFEDELYGTYSLDDIDKSSAKIYSYLSGKGISAESIVAIQMKRSARVLITMLGVWKAGAAFTAIGENSPESYVDRILSDAGEYFLFTDDTFEEAMLFQCKHGWSIADEHNLACIVYSTGSSGFYKGSLHEYGSIYSALEKIEVANEKPLYETGKQETRNILPYPLNSINSIIELLITVFFGNYYYIVPYRTTYSFSRLAQLLNDKKIEVVCVSADNYRKLKQYDLPYLKQIDLSLDVNIDELDEGCVYSNTYALTEAFGWVTSGYIEKKENDVIPSGKPCPLTKVKICDKEGAELPKGEIGEIYVFNPFFRGYAKLPELSDATIRDNWIVTGDIGYVDEDDNFVVLGRKVDMVETENGLIIPILISVQIKKWFPDITKNYVKLFVNEKNNQIKVCIFYCGKENHTINEFIDAFRGKLPEYMMPTHCVKKENFKFLYNGKVDRNYFKEPK